jgi:hypothetical protein
VRTRAAASKTTCGPLALRLSSSHGKRRHLVHAQLLFQAVSLPVCASFETSHLRLDVNENLRAGACQTTSRSTKTPLHTRCWPTPVDRRPSTSDYLLRLLLPGGCRRQAETLQCCELQGKKRCRRLKLRYVVWLHRSSTQRTWDVRVLAPRCVSALLLQTLGPSTYAMCEQRPRANRRASSETPVTLRTCAPRLRACRASSRSGATGS